MKILQTSEKCNIIQPNLLIIFDGCDAAIQKLVEEFSAPELDCKKHNIPLIIGAEKFRSVKILVTCREESLQDIKRREPLFAPAQSMKNHFKDLYIQNHSYRGRLNLFRTNKSQGT